MGIPTITEDTILFTKHGSHLYGLAHAGSDIDYFRVTRNGRKGFQKVYPDGTDVTTKPLDRFMELVYSGSHQACEALFSPYAWMHPDWEPVFKGWRVRGTDAFAKYRRTIAAFSYGDFKRRRHAMRLGYNLAQLRKTGTMNPVLTEDQARMSATVAQLYKGQSLTDIAINL